MKTKTMVWVTSSIQGFHRWLNAPNDVAFLRNYHRHIFHVRIGILVSDLDREIEFFQLKNQLEAYLSTQYQNEYFDKSCEMMAMEILVKLSADFVEVSEDGENGATVERIE